LPIPLFLVRVTGLSSRERNSPPDCCCQGFTGFRPLILGARFKSCLVKKIKGIAQGYPFYLWSEWSYRIPRNYEHKRYSGGRNQYFSIELSRISVSSQLNDLPKREVARLVVHYLPSRTHEPEDFVCLSCIRKRFAYIQSAHRVLKCFLQR